MSEKTKLKLIDLNVTSFKTMEELKGGDLPTADVNCIPNSQDRHCTVVERICRKLVPITEQHNDTACRYESNDQIWCNQYSHMHIC